MRPAGMELWQARRRRVRALHGSGGVSAATLHGATLLAWLAMPVPALAQDNVVATATLPRDLSPWGMYLNADPVVKAGLIGLAFGCHVDGVARQNHRDRVGQAPCAGGTQ